MVTQVMPHLQPHPVFFGSSCLYNQLSTIPAQLHNPWQKHESTQPMTCLWLRFSFSNCAKYPGLHPISDSNPCQCGEYPYGTYPTYNNIYATPMVVVYDHILHVTHQIYVPSHRTAKYPPPISMLSQAILLLIPQMNFLWLLKWIAVLLKTC